VLIVRISCLTPPPLADFTVAAASNQIAKFDKKNLKKRGEKRKERVAEVRGNNSNRFET